MAAPIVRRSRSFAVQILLFLCSILLNDGSSGLAVVKTMQGFVKGTKRTSLDSTRDVHAFLGVPYAEAPVGNLRLAPPQPPHPWEDKRQASKHGAHCPQDYETFASGIHPFTPPSTEVSEDCLNLDIYTPDVIGKRPVLVFFHGGDFVAGKSSMADGTAIVAHEDIVFISVNYRLGILGLLYNEDDTISANLALQDQQMALRWIQENVAEFGGDPSRVTIAGQGAGGVSVTAHILSPSSRGLFHRAISQGGSLLTRLPVSAKELSAVIAQRLECPKTTNLVECIRTKSLADILAAQRSLEDHLTLVPDGRLIPSNPRAEYAQGNFSTVPHLVGVVSNDGYLLLKGEFPSVVEDEKVDATQAKMVLRELLERYYSDKLDKISQEVMDFYVGKDHGNRPPFFLQRRMVEIAAELMIHVPAFVTATLHAVEVPDTYFYEFSHRPSFLRGVRPKWHRGADHGYDVIFCRGLPLLSNNGMADIAEFTPLEQELAKTVMRYWGNFIRTGDPNGPGLTTWDKFSKEKQNYVILQPSPFVSKRFKSDRMAFWDSRLRHTEQRKPDHLRHEEL